MGVKNVIKYLDGVVAQFNGLINALHDLVKPWGEKKVMGLIMNFDALYDTLSFFFNMSPTADV